MGVRNWFKDLGHKVQIFHGTAQHNLPVEGSRQQKRHALLNNAKIQAGGLTDENKVRLSRRIRHRIARNLMHRQWREQYSPARQKLGGFVAGAGVGR